MGAAQRLSDLFMKRTGTCGEMGPVVKGTPLVCL